MPPTWEIVKAVGEYGLGLGSAIASVTTYMLRTARISESKRMESIADAKSLVIKLALEEHEKKDDRRFDSNTADHARLVADNSEILSRLDQIEETRKHDHVENRGALEALEADNKSKLEKINALDNKLSALSADVRTLMDWFRSKF